MQRQALLPGILCAGAALLAACGAAGTVPATPPDALSFSWSGFRAARLSLRLEDDTLHCLVLDLDRETELQGRPEAAAWQAFAATLAELQVERWQREYVDPDLVDGISWQFAVERDGERIASGGQNLFPGAEGRASEWAERIERLRAAFATLLPGCELRTEREAL